MHSLQERVIFEFLQPFPLLCFLLLLIFIYKWIYPNFQNEKNNPPSPPRLPIIGNLHQMGTYPYRNLKNLSQKYGDLMLLHLGNKPAIVVSSSEMASQVLKTHDLIFASRPSLGVLRRLTVNGKDLFSLPYGEYCRQLRSFCTTQLLSTKKVKSFRGVREEEVAMMMRNIKSRSTSVVDLSQMLISLTVDMICRVAFGKKYVNIDFNTLLDEIIKLYGSYFVGDFVSWLGWVDWVSGVDAKVSKVASTFDGFLETILEEHLGRQRQRHIEEESEMIMTDFVDVLLEGHTDDGTGKFNLDKEGVKGLIFDIFIGGSETTYVTLEWMMSELLRNPRAMQELQNEVRGITGDKEEVEEDDLKNMKYLKAVIKETLRLHPPAPLLGPHESTEDVKINGYDIVKGTLVIINVWSISRDPDNWEEPESFYPERFLNSSIDFRGQDFQFLPFGSGRRMCPGIGFATATIELVAANLVHQFDWALPNEETLDMNEAPGMSVHRQNPLLAIPTPRFG